jgi:diguanylate cyclase (GGDEF)-like protein
VNDGERNLGGISISLGLAMFPEHGTDPEMLIKAADSALYQAKRAGRDRVVLFAKERGKPLAAAAEAAASA